MKVCILVLLLTLVVSCGKNSSSKSGPTQPTSQFESILTMPGLRSFGIRVDEIGHRTSEDHFAVTCQDVEGFTNQDRLNNLNEILDKLVNNNKTRPNEKYRFDCSRYEKGCFLSGTQVEMLFKEAIKTLEYYHVILPSKYCPNHNLTEKGIILSVQKE